MPIPESQLDIWSHQGSITQSSTTYKTIKNALMAEGSPYSGKNYNVFLQGSYGNDTNIYAESDVDIVIKLNDCFYHDLSELPDDQSAIFRIDHPGTASYTHKEFKRDVLSILTTKYGNDVKAGDKAISIAGSGIRRKADVIAAVQYKRYTNYFGVSSQHYYDGMCFFTGSGIKIANYPVQHSENLTTKHQRTNKWFKPMVRVVKNLRSRLIDEKMIEPGVAPSYYLEGLLYNVPDDKFADSYQDCFVNCFNWILESDRSKFVCANEQYYLLRNDCPVTWQASSCNEFLAAVQNLWHDW